MSKEKSTTHQGLICAEILPTYLPLQKSDNLTWAIQSKIQYLVSDQLQKMHVTSMSS